MNDSIERKLREIIKTELNGKGEIYTDNFVESGSGFLTNYFLVELRSKRKKLELFVKICDNDDYNHMKIVRLLFANEIWWYARYIPAIDQFLGSKSLDPTEINPKHYGHCSDPMREFLLLEDIKANGFQMYDRKKDMDDEHFLLVLRTAANCHAYQFALKHHRPQKFNKLVGMVQTSSMAECGLDEAIESNLETYFEDCGVEQFPANAEQIKKSIMDGYYASESFYDEHCIVVQTDLWCNNMMFKYKHEQPIDLRFYDFQFLLHSTPVCSLSVFFYTECSERILQNFNRYLKWYHQKLDEKLKQLQTDCEIVYPYNVFREHWKRHAIYGLANALIILKDMLATREEKRSASSTVMLTKRKPSSRYVFRSKHDDEYNKRVTSLLHHFIKNDFITISK